MQLFIDTADLQEARRAAGLGVISGATTNPKLAAAAAPGDFEQRIRQMLDIVSGPISVEVLAENADDMLVEAADYAAWDPRIAVKIPLTLEGLPVIRQLERERDIRVNVTCMMNANQALLALMAGASYVSLFVGRISDMGYDAYAVIAETADLIERGGFGGRIIAGSMRQVGDIQRSFQAGAHIVTTQYDYLAQMAHHPRTVETIEEFKQAWDQAQRQGDLR